MEYGMMVTTPDTKKLDRNGIEYTYWDIETMLMDGFPKQFEIVFESEEDFNKAKKILSK